MRDRHFRGAIRRARLLAPQRHPASGRCPIKSPDRAAHAGTAKPAISARILREILLMVIFRIIEGARVENLGGDRIEAARLERTLVHCLALFGEFALLRREHINAGAILRADVVALTHALRRIVILPERLEQGSVRNLPWIVDNEHHFVVTGSPGAALFVAWVWGMAAGIANRRNMNALAQFPKLPLRPPETAHAEHRFLEVRRKLLERPVQHEMLARRRDRTSS